MAQQNITSGNAPILWSTVDAAFQKINANFTELYLSIGGSGVDLTNLSSDVNPSVTEFYDLGSPTRRWKDLYLSGSSLHLGSAVITSTGSVVNLPAGSSIGGNILDQEYFKTIAVAGQTDIVADAGGTDTLTFAAGNGVTLTTDALTDTLTITNAGVLTAVAGTGIGVSAPNGNVTFSNTGVLSITAGSGVSVSAPNGNLTIANTGVLSVVTDVGSGISLDTSVPGVVRVTNSSPNIPQDTFKQVAVAGQTVIQADLPNDTLTLANGSGIDITTNASIDTVTITNTGVTSLAVTSPGLSITGSTGSLTLSNTGVVAISAGSGISINTSTGTVVVSNSRFGFSNIAVLGQNPIQADNTTDTVTFVGGEGVVLTTNEINDSLTIDVSYLVGNVYSDSSTLLVNADSGKIVGDVDTASLRVNSTFVAVGLEAGLVNQNIHGVALGYRAGRLNQDEGAVAVGYDAGLSNQGYRAVAIGDGAGDTSQGMSAVAIGTQAGQTNQGAYSIAIGALSSNANQSANSIIINATGSSITASGAGFYIAPIREVTGPQILYYNPSDKEITWGPVPAGVGGSGGGDFELNVAGDDSTVRRIFSGETLKFVGAGGITATTDGEGQITITGPSLATVATSGSYNDLSNKPSIPAAYSVTSIDALADVDTSTTAPTDGQSLVWSSASSKWLPSTVAGGGGGSLQSRSNVAGTTSSLANGATGNLTITGYKGYMLYKIQTSAAAWVRIYTDIASRTADASRVEGADPAPGAGVVAEVITTGAQTILVSPGALGFSNESSPDTNIQLAVTNKSGGTTTITVTLTVVQLEA